MSLLLTLSLLTAADPAAVTITKDKDGLTFSVGSEVVTKYRHGPDVAKPYFWPVHAAGGVPVTRGWPMEEAKPGGTKDHVHQKSVWFCHGDVIPEGIEITKKPKGVEGADFWSEVPGHSKIVCLEVGEPKSNGRSASVTTRNAWQTPEGHQLLDEVRTLSLHALGDARLFVLDIDLRAVVPVTFGDTKEGAMGVRVNDEIMEKGGNGKITNAEGKASEKAVWGEVSAWCDYSGTVEGKPVGIAVFDDPKNPYPACWHSRGYGLMAANPFGRNKSGFPAMKGKTELVKLTKGDHLKLRYGVLVHTGDAVSGKVAERYAEFVKLK